MTQDMTEMILTERDTYCETEQGNSLCTHKEMSPSRHTLSILMEQLRSSLGAGKEQLRSSLEYANSDITARCQRHYGSCPTRLRLVVIMLLTLMTFGVRNAWAQDLSGVYYIASDNTASGGDEMTSYSNANDDKKWYLVPADNPQQDDKRDAWYSPNHTTSSPGDPEKPFLTTYRTNKDAAVVPNGVTERANNSVWIIKKTSDNYYHVIHAATGKYVIYEVPLKNDPNYNNKPNENDNGKRKTMHLQTPDEETYSLSTNENYKFTISKDNDNIYRLQPKRRSGWYWNPASGNKKEYYGQSAGNVTDIYQAGLVGVYNGANDGGSKWHFETAQLAAPTITCTNGIVTVPNYNGLPAGYHVRYTVDGSDPTASSTVLEGSYEVSSACTFKAVIEQYGFVLTSIAEQVVEPNVRKPVFTPNADGSVTITVEEGNIIYYTLDGTDPTTSTPTYATTTVTLSASDLEARLLLPTPIRL